MNIMRFLFYPLIFSSYLNCANALVQEKHHVTISEKKLTMALYITPLTKEAFFPVIYEFEQQTGIKVEIVKYTEDYEFEKYMTRWLVDGSNSPDLLYGQASVRFQTIVKAGYVHTINHLWEKNNWHQKFPKTLMNWISYQGKIYGVPYLRAAWGLFYKKSLLKEFGPVPKQWPEFIAYCQRLLDAGIPPFNASLKQAWIASAWFEYFILRTYGIEFFNSITKGEVSFHDARIQQTFKQWAKLIDKGFYNTDYAKIRWEETLPLFYRNKFAFFFMSERLANNLVNNKLYDDIEFIAFPSMEKYLFMKACPPCYFSLANTAKKNNLLSNL